MENKREYNKTLLPFWTTPNGHAFSGEIRAEDLKAMQETLKVGGKLFLKYIPESSRTKDTSPNGFIEFVSPEKVAEGKRFAGSRKLQTATDEI